MSILLERVVEAFPKQFVTRIIARQQALYSQSIDMSFKDQSWEDPEANYIFPHNRRVLFESELRKTAKEYGLNSFNSSHAGDNCAYVMVKAKGLIITEHYVDGPNQFVRHAVSREGNAGVNKWLDEYTDENLLTQPLPKLGSNPIYLNLIHGCKFNKSPEGVLSVAPDSCFLRIAVPNEAFDKYLYNWSAQEILMAYASTPNSAAAPQAIEDQAVPKTKLKAKKRSAGKPE